VRKALKKVIFGDNWRSRAFRNARGWSNRELEKIAPRLSGRIVNVSAWEDKDKEGRLYQTYFLNADSYEITNFGTDQGKLQGSDNEFYLDLEGEISPSKIHHYDAVFNHTTLEHIYDFRRAFSNLCSLSKDIVVIVVPWLQPLHSNYGDYWRFSPQAVVRMFRDEGLTTLHLSWNEQPRSSVYVFAVATRQPEKWTEIFGPEVNPDGPGFLDLPDDFAGRYAF
jgi:hypothetical protein